MLHMPEFTFIIFRLPDQRLVLQRRTDDAPYAPGRLGIFGGWLEEGETAEECLHREIQEETSLAVEELTITFIKDFVIPKSDDFDRDRHVYLYEAEIHDMGFEIYEGDGAKAYSLPELMQREDLVYSARYTFEHVY